MKSTEIKTSRYVSGGTTENEELGLGWWERNEFEFESDDQLIIVNGRHVHRIDLIANDFLGDSRLWWLVAQYNGILDPHSEIVEGKYLRIPAQSRLQKILSGKTGGVESTKELAPKLSGIKL